MVKNKIEAVPQITQHLNSNNIMMDNSQVVEFVDGLKGREVSIIRFNDVSDCFVTCNINKVKKQLKILKLRNIVYG